MFRMPLCEPLRVPFDPDIPLFFFPEKIPRPGTDFRGAVVMRLSLRGYSAENLKVQWLVYFSPGRRTTDGHWGLLGESG